MDLRDLLENPALLDLKVLWDPRERMVDLVYLDHLAHLETEDLQETSHRLLDPLVTLVRRELLVTLVYLVKMETRERGESLVVRVHKVCLVRMEWMV